MSDETTSLSPTIELGPDEGLLEGLAHPARARIARSLRAGRIPHDDAFDRFLPDELRMISARFWTPLETASRVASWLTELGAESVLDVGSGVGKLAVALALCSDLRVVGLEHRPRLVSVARRLARSFAVEPRVTFVEGALGEVPLPSVDAYYLYNPFGENLFGVRDCVDLDVELGRERFARDVVAVLRLLHEAPLGHLLVTYNGFGGNVPDSYVQRRIDLDLPCSLVIYEKVRSTRDEPLPSYCCVDEPSEEEW